jgi:hypothetical protein
MGTGGDNHVITPPTAVRHLAEGWRRKEQRKRTASMAIHWTPFPSLNKKTPGQVKCPNSRLDKPKKNAFKDLPTL